MSWYLKVSNRCIKIYITSGGENANIPKTTVGGSHTIDLDAGYIYLILMGSLCNLIKTYILHFHVLSLYTQHENARIIPPVCQNITCLIWIKIV